VALRLELFAVPNSSDSHASCQDDALIA